MDTNTTELLQTITAKIKKLKERNMRLEKQNESLQQSVFSYLQKIEEQNNALASYKVQSATNAIATNMIADKKEILKELDRQINQIDKCILSISADK